MSSDEAQYGGSHSSSSSPSPSSFWVGGNGVGWEGFNSFMVASSSRGNTDLRPLLLCSSSSAAKSACLLALRCSGVLGTLGSFSEDPFGGKTGADVEDGDNEDANNDDDDDDDDDAEDDDAEDGFDPGPPGGGGGASNARNSRDGGFSSSGNGSRSEISDSDNGSRSGRSSNSDDSVSRVGSGLLGGPSGAPTPDDNDDDDDDDDGAPPECAAANMFILSLIMGLGTALRGLSLDFGSDSGALCNTPSVTFLALF